MRWWLLGALVLAALALWAVVLIALRYREPRALCGWGLESLGPACCALGQTLEAGRCEGEIVTCPAGLMLVQKPRPGCVLENEVINLSGGRLSVAPVDWEAEGSVEAKQVDIEPFSIDALEVSVARFSQCVQAKSCRQLAGNPRPGEPVTGVTPRTAERFCMFIGGRLPTSDEWLYAAAGSAGRRFAWGDTGLVCRRAAYGLVRGPCASGAVGPTLVGSRPAGRTPEGLYDMAGNVAEWTRQGKAHVARGGSFRSTQAKELKSWAHENTQQAAPHIGFRCAYDPPG